VKLLLLSDTYSEHTEKWALGLAESGFQVGIFSFNKSSYPWYEHPNITVFFEPDKKINAESNLTKLAYIKYVTVLKKIIKQFKPDVLHAHYATSYGLVGALSGFHPFVISAWGTDVMRFPQKNFVAKSILKYNFRNADLICATSPTIKEYIQQFVNKPVTIVPFGIDIADFKPKTNGITIFEPNDFVIASIKPLETIYKIDVLIEAFAELCNHYKHIRLLILGEGSEFNNLKLLCEKLKVNEKVCFTGRVPFNQVSNYFNACSILVNISEYESFGVSVIEAMACGKPTVVTNVGGLKDVVENDDLGIKVEVGNISQTYNAIEKYIINPDYYKTVSQNGINHVIKHYNWKDNLQQMMEEYKHIIKSIDK
jgi:L-malate glycosyltransferase